MTIQNIALFKALGSKMQYLDAKQKVLAQNISNTDTPNYTAREISTPDFGRTLKKVTGDNSVRLSTRTAGHMAPVGEAAPGRNQKQGEFYEVAPGKNAVVLEEQMLKATEASMDHSLMLNVMKKNIGMIRMAIGNNN